MARLSERLPENVPGDFYVDRSCIDCSTCRIIDSRTFGWTGSGQSYVRSQPGSDEERRRALMALVSCPTASIGTVRKLDASAAARSFPEPIEDDVYYCGYASESSFGASSYFIRRPGGNVLVDSPRASRLLFERIEELGGVRWMFLTHRDDVADHQKWARAFECERILHREDVSPDTRDIERVVEGDSPVELAPDLVALPVPGHTRGSMALWYRRKFLFTGDHLWAAPDGRRLWASPRVCWYSWPEQTRSMEKLLALDFVWVLPGHGFRHRAETAEAMKAAVKALLERMRAH